MLQQSSETWSAKFRITKLWILKYNVSNVLEQSFKYATIKFLNFRSKVLNYKVLNLKL
jgi:hypothetical protein